MRIVGQIMYIITNRWLHVFLHNHYACKY